MSASFAIVDQDIHALGSINEIILAYNERRAAVHQVTRSWNGFQWSNTTGLPSINAGIDVQHHDFFAEQQQWIMDNCGLFMPPATTDYAGVAPDGFKTISELADAASQTDWEYFCETILGGDFYITSSAYGFRNIVPGSSGYGVCDAGDYIQCFDDTSYFDLYQQLRAAYSALKITKLSGSATYGTDVADRAAGDGLSGDIGLHREQVDLTIGELAVAQAAYDADEGDEASGPPWATYENFDNGLYVHYFKSRSSSVKYYVPASVVAQVSTITLYFAPVTASGSFSGHGTDAATVSVLNSVGSLDKGSGGLKASPLLLQVDHGADFALGPGYAPVGFFADSSLATPWFGLVIWSFSNSDS